MIVHEKRLATDLRYSSVILGGETDKCVYSFAPHPLMENEIGTLTGVLYLSKDCKRECADEIFVPRKK